MFSICFIDDFYYAEGTADTVFYVNVDGKCFPDNQWTDFAIPVLHMWISNIIENFQKQKAEFILNFMDGPYYINCSKQGSTVHLTCIEDKKHKATICECDVSIEVIIHELFDVSSQIIKIVEGHKFDRLRNFEELKWSLKRLVECNRSMG